MTILKLTLLHKFFNERIFFNQKNEKEGSVYVLAGEFDPDKE